MALPAIPVSTVTGAVCMGATCPGSPQSMTVALFETLPETENSLPASASEQARHWGQSLPSWIHPGFTADAPVSQAPGASS